MDCYNDFMAASKHSDSPAVKLPQSWTKSSGLPKVNPLESNITFQSFWYM